MKDGRGRGRHVEDVTEEESGTKKYYGLKLSREAAAELISQVKYAQT